jgi:RNA-dependent RNA polymerase
LGVPDEAFIKLQDTMLMRLASMLLFENVALEMLSHASVAGGLKTSVLRKSGMMVTCEPFFRSLLLAMYKSKLSDLLRRARIAIPQCYGRLMVGVLDETKTLEYGQVFIRYTKNINEPDKEFITLTGEVVITKNPCFHPGLLLVHHRSHS